MFNGIVTNTGKIKKIKKDKKNSIIDLISKIKFKNRDIGSSVSCSGACLTLYNFNKNVIKFFLSKETLNKTIFKSSKIGDIINLERPMKYGQSISGHFVQGHVDTISKVSKIQIIGKSLVFNFSLSKKYKKNIVEKGSITINGVSLTVAKVLKNGFQISVIPQTLKLTNLINLRNKDIVNVEFDILGKYINSFVK